MSRVLTGSARLAGVLGWPVSHSRSPLLHGHWIEEYGIDGAYVPLPVRPNAFPNAVRALADLGFAGANVTIPHKEAALRIADEVTDLARTVGAANTLVFQDDGRILADNTDVFGFYENLRQQQPDWRPDSGPALVLGAGGAARAVVAALKQAGCPTLRIANRTRERAQHLVDALWPKSEVHDWDRIAEAASGTTLIVNTTSLGMQGHEPLIFPLDTMDPGGVVADIVYTPQRTPLLCNAARLGVRTAEGLGMLLHQARPGFQAWFGVLPAVTEALIRKVGADIPLE